MARPLGIAALAAWLAAPSARAEPAKLVRAPTAALSGQVRQDMAFEAARASEGSAEPEAAATTSESTPEAARASEEPGAEPEAAASTSPEEARAPAKRAPTAPRLEIGPTAGLAAVFGIGAPASLAGWSASGGFVGAELRLRRGFVAGLELRSTTARNTGYIRLNRMRAALALGYSLRRGLFELRLLGAFTVEPWWVALRADNTGREWGTPLLGAAFTMAPGISAALRPGVRLHVGLRVELSASALPGASTVLRVRDPYGGALFRLGGAEMTAAVEVGVRWGVPR